MSRTLVAAIFAAVTLVACGDSGDAEPASDNARQERTTQRPASPAPPPDAGVAAGHGADPQRVAVPDRDASPPRAVVRLTGPDRRTRAEATMPGRSRPQRVRLDSPRLRGTTVGRDPESGVARVRVSLLEVLTCRGRDGSRFRRQRVRYFPPPQIERIRAAPGALLQTTRSRSLPLALSQRRCGERATLARVHGELWGEAINGLGLEAVTPHIVFDYEPPNAPS